MSNMAEEIPRFALLEGTIDDFIDEQENKNTQAKTARDLNLLKVFLQSKEEHREVENIPPAELNELLSEFILAVRTKEGKEYEPTSLRGMVASFERFLRRKNYQVSIIKDLAFEKTRKTLQSKQKQLKKQGKGNKSNASVALTDDEKKVLYEKGLLGISSPEALLNSIWLNNSVHFGLRGIQEHHTMCWGDLTLNKTVDGVEYLEYNERQTKTRTGANATDVRPFAPKMFATDGSEKDPVTVYKVFAQKRPGNMKESDSPFYLAVNNVKVRSASSSKPWFKSNKVGVNKLGKLMKDMAEKAGLENPKLTNHSARKTMIQTLSEKGVPPSHIAQLSGHRNLKSIENYSALSTKQQQSMSNMLANISEGNVLSLPNAASVQNPIVNAGLSSLAQPQQSSSNTGQQSVALFSGAVIQGGQFSVTINTVNQSPTIPFQENRPWKRIRVLSSSSDED